MPAGVDAGAVPGAPAGVGAGAVPGAPAGAVPVPPQRTTPGRLRRMLAMLLAATVLVWITATILVQGQQDTVRTVRGTTAPELLDAIEAQAALSDADRAAWQSFRSDEAPLTGPGPQYQNDITTASQNLEGLAALVPSGAAVSQQLQTISGQLVTYQGLVEQADAAKRAATALHTASDHDLGYAYLTNSSLSLRDSQGGLLASIKEVAGIDSNALSQQLGSPWTNPALLLVAAAAGAGMLVSIIVAWVFLLRRFRRAVSLPLLAAAVLTCGLLAWMALVMLPADSAFAAARNTALPGLTAKWQAQIHTVDAQAKALRAHTGSRAGPLTRLPTAGVLDTDLAAAGDSGGLPIGIPVLAIVIAGLAYLGIKARLDEYRG